MIDRRAGQPLPAEPPDEAYSALVEAVRTGKCILFLGAGLHSAPPTDSPFWYVEHERPASARALGEIIANNCECGSRLTRDCSYAMDQDLRRVSLCYELKFSRNMLAAVIRAAVQEDKRPSPLVRGLAELSFGLVLTTNYDTHFEDACRMAGKNPVVGWFDPEQRSPTHAYPLGREPTFAEPYIFKPHGTVDDPRSIVITDEDYLAYVVRLIRGQNELSPIPATFRYYLKRWPIVFIGYSLLDRNLRAALAIEMGDPESAPGGFAVDVMPDLLNAQIHRRSGIRFVIEDIWTFVPELYRDVLGADMPL